MLWVLILFILFLSKGALATAQSVDITKSVEAEAACDAAFITGETLTINGAYLMD